MAGAAMNEITNYLVRSRDVIQAAIDDPAFGNTVAAIAERIGDALGDGKKLLIAGNGGSAGDAQHIAAEIVGRYKRERPAYPALALTTDTSALTAIANDYGYERVFERQVEGLGVPGDVLLALSTSGRSPSILAALRAGRKRGLVTIGFTGSKGHAMGVDCDHLMVAPADETALIQQIHLAVAHGICDFVEQTLLSKA
jgi:D-sedoheptulose 7-phosphate isomerase